MALLVTDAIVLHAFDYLETSRILRLITRDAGVQSVLARGARSSKKRFGGAMDLFAEGEAELTVKPGRELHALSRFDVAMPRAAIGLSLERFTAAGALAECVLRVVHDEAAPGLYDGVSRGLSAIAAANDDSAAAEGLGALWALVAAVGFAPALDVCASCHNSVSPHEDVTFSHAQGGVLCQRCSGMLPGCRRLPESAREAISAWIEGRTVSIMSAGERRSHQRLFREFLAHHLPDNRPLPAYAIWEQGRLEG